MPLEGLIYNLEPPNGLGSDFGVALEIAGVYAHTFIEGNVEWASDYHDYFEVHNIPPGLISSRLTFYGTKALAKTTPVENFGFPAQPQRLHEDSARTDDHAHRPARKKARGGRALPTPRAPRKPTINTRPS